jgi:serine/threonine protein phosphatase PrpC
LRSSFGDFKLKGYVGAHPAGLLTAEPHVVSRTLTPGDAMLLLASDGVTDVLCDARMVELALDAVHSSGMVKKQVGVFIGDCVGVVFDLIHLIYLMHPPIIMRAQDESIAQQRAHAAASAVCNAALAAGAWDNLTVVAVLLDW